MILNFRGKLPMGVDAEGRRHLFLHLPTRAALSKTQGDRPSMLFPGFFIVAKSFAVIDFNHALQKFFGDLRRQVFDATENASAFTHFRFEVFDSGLLIHGSSPRR
jgi:hypothetical protein